MKNQNLVQKKLVAATSDKKLIYPNNPYNDLPISNSPQNHLNNNKIIKIQPKVTDNNRPQIIKTSKIVSP